MKFSLFAAAAAGAAIVGFAGPAAAEAQSATYQTATVRGIDIFYREAGPKSAPTVLLLHGFPSSSHMFRNLIPLLATKYHVIAPDYPGFGYSGQPSSAEFDYSFGSLASLIDEFTDKVEARSYTLYMQDYGGPVGFRLAIKHPDRVRGLIVQNAVANVEGWNPDIVKQLAPFWKERNVETEKPIRVQLQPETTKWQYTHGASRPERLSPDAWTHDQSHLDRHGNDAVQLQYFWNYQDNVRQYPVWQEYLKTKQPPTLIVWGKNDPYFTMSGVETIKSLVPKAEANIYDAGHFALETHVEEIAAKSLAFLDRLQKVNHPGKTN